MTRLRVAFAGPHVTLQDSGRKGLMRFGVPASGPMDRKAFAIAHAALGNAPDSVAVEVSMGGLTLDCVEGEVTFGVVGGGFIVQKGAERVGSWHIQTLRGGERLMIRPGPWGSWTYLTFAGQMEAPRWLGSAATHGPSGLGGGRLVAGQELVVNEAKVLPALEGAIPCPIWARPRPVIHAVAGPQDRFFSAESLADLASMPFYLTNAYDRMGVRLRGPSLMPKGALSIPSEPILRGSLQVAGDGLATVMLADHGTTGGYPKIATVVSDDLDGFVQLRPNDAVRFKLIAAPEAVALARGRAKAAQDYLSRSP
jgi:allophanate hydrolase